eukprot:gene22-396_t
MVLADLSSKISGAFRNLHKSTVVDDEAIDACLKEIAAALLYADVNVKMVSSMRKSIKNKLALEEAAGTSINKRKLIQKLVSDELISMLTPDRDPFKLVKGSQNVVMFVGLQGCGKTTTCTKFAHYYQRKGWKVALVCADTFRAGAFDQLKQNATKARIPFYGSYTETDPVRIAEEGVEMFKKEKYEIIIVDTSGRHKQETALFEEMQQVSEAVDPDDVIFVMDSHIGQACSDQAKAFASAVPIGSVIVTKLDGHAKGGGALSAVAATDAPIIFIGTGEHFDEFEPFEPRSFVSRLCGFGDVQGLVKTISEVVDMEKQPEMMQRMAKGVFTLRDMYSQLQNVTKLGPMGRVMDMIPGMNQLNLPPGAEREGMDRLKNFMTVMDSLTEDELDCKVKLEASDSRVIRVARGAGTSPIEIYLLLQQHKQFEKMIGKMGKSGLMSMNDPQGMQQMMRNPKQMMNKLSQCVDPNMLKAMGGSGNLMNMVKEMEGAMGGKGGGMPGMEGMGDMGGMMEMMKQMKGAKGGGRNVKFKPVRR